MLGGRKELRIVRAKRNTESCDAKALGPSLKSGLDWTGSDRHHAEQAEILYRMQEVHF